jgi:hypothetical protein
MEPAPGRRLRTGSIAAAIGVSLALASTAVAASLHVAANPSRTALNDPVTVTLSGRFKPSDLRGSSHAARLAAYVQTRGTPCKSSGTAERAAGGRLYYAANISHSPFSHSDTKAGNRVTIFRICAYLYPRPITKTTHDKPLKRATVTFRVKP